MESGSVWSNDRDRVGTQALVELGVSTGLSLMFALLKQTWTTAVRLKVTKALTAPSCDTLNFDHPLVIFDLFVRIVLCR